MLECADCTHPLTNLEQQVVDFLNKHAGNMANMTISDIAYLTYSSIATVSRAVRKCGFDSFSAARNDLLHTDHPIHNQAGISAVLERSLEECTRTITDMDIASVECVADMIRNSKRVLLLSRGLTRIVAEEFCFYLECLRFHVSMVTDSELMRKLDIYAMPSDLVIILTAQNTTPELAIAARHAKQMGCQVVTFCCKKGTSLEEFSDLVLLGYSLHISPTQAYGGFSRIPLMLITRTVVEYIGTLNQQGQEQPVEKNTLSSQKKKWK